MTTVFFGTPGFAVPSLETLAEASRVALVVSQPDRPAGRGRKLEPPPVKIAAQRLGLPVIQPERVRGRGFAERISKLRPDLLVTAAFGRVFGRRLLAVPRLAPINVHASLLPRHRGAAPISAAILAGDEEAGVSIMRMERGLDSGPVYLTARTRIGPEETAGELTERLADLGARALADAVARFEDLVPAPQDEDRATYAPALSKADGAVDWRRGAVELHRQIRAMHPWPCAATALGGDPLKLHAARVVTADAAAGEPGTVIRAGREGVDVACGRGVLRLVEIQAAGRKRMDAAAFLAGSAISEGLRLG